MVHLLMVKLHMGSITFIFNEWPGIQCGSKHMVAGLVWRLFGSSCYCSRFTYTTLILVKGALDARGSKLMPDKKDFGYSFPCDGPGRGGTCDISAWDAFYWQFFGC
uniref:photosystem I n=1 Tax=Helianthus annuus TaxID=4232 RepID=A0A1Y3BZ60_HELAN